MRTLKPFKKVEVVETIFPFSSGESPLERTEVPIEEDGNVKIAVSYVKPKPQPEVPYVSFSAARVYENGDLSPIILNDCRVSPDMFETVKSVENLIDSANV